MAHFEWDAATRDRNAVCQWLLLLMFHTQSFNESLFSSCFRDIVHTPHNVNIQFSLASSAAPSGPLLLLLFFDCIFASNGKHNNNIESRDDGEKKNDSNVGFSFAGAEFVISERDARSQMAIKTAEKTCPRGTFAKKNQKNQTQKPTRRIQWKEYTVCCEGE